MRRNRAFAIAAAIALLVVALVGLALYRYYDAQVYDPRRTGQGAVVIDIAPGVGVSGAAEVLASRGIIGSTLVFELYVRTHGLADRLEAGHYTIPGGLSMAQVLGVISHAQGAQVKVTIPEGYTTRQIGALMEQKGLFSAAAYVTAANDGTYLQPFLSDRPPGYGLEGYLFPDTYFFDARATPGEVIKAQLSHFGEKVPLDLRSHAADHQLTFAQTVVIASIVEREAAFDKDRAFVAAVFYNRLARGMPLQSDATVAYAKGQATTVINEEDKKLNSPFNTYLHSGLPPAPISNPGLASLNAALLPAPGFDYLYFLTDPTGHAHFSRTLTQHEQCQVNLSACPTAP